jgi:DNA mismatch repair protein MutS
MGKRLLKEAITKPLQNTDEINRRLDIAEAFKNNKILLENIREKLKYVSDLENILTRLAL